ncbi:hypothetical protein [uncultured Cutibacterium sp.]|uniref:hypothetical protein n=1 Tax=uncultured Cutibacterium sp. TaxID=1912223 RepID=UPI0025982DA0|nr:hypothetical protein [uncultured Cutibacterium sp.]
MSSTRAASALPTHKARTLAIAGDFGSGLVVFLRPGESVGGVAVFVDSGAVGAQLGFGSGVALVGRSISA